MGDDITRNSVYSKFERYADARDDCRQRLHDEYWELVTRIEKLEMELLKSSLDADAKELLIEQRKAMLAYKDALFRRCFHHNVDLYRDTTTQTAIYPDEDEASIEKSFEFMDEILALIYKYR
jgi:hypothetical protein